MPKGKLSLDEGTISAEVSGTRVDAAVTQSGGFAGLELAITTANVYIGTEQRQHAPLMLSLALHPNTLQQIATVALDALGTPAFTQGEWLEIATALDTLGTYDANPTTIAPERLRELALRIREAYGQ